jgi:hypothetical protein
MVNEGQPGTCPWSRVVLYTPRYDAHEIIRSAGAEFAKCGSDPQEEAGDQRMRTNRSNDSRHQAIINCCSVLATG